MSDQTPRIHNRESSLLQDYFYESSSHDHPLCVFSSLKRSSEFSSSKNVLPSFDMQETILNEDRDDGLSLTNFRYEYSFDHLENRDEAEDIDGKHTPIRYGCGTLESSPSDLSRCDSTVSASSHNQSLTRIKRACPVYDEEDDDDVLSPVDYTCKRRKPTHYSSPSDENVTKLFWTQRVE